MDIFGDMGHPDVDCPPGRFFNPLADLAIRGVWEKVCVGCRIGVRINSWPPS